MKAIKNKSMLESVLVRESPNWQEIVYDKTGVIAVFNSSGTSDCSIDLISSCGYIDAEIDSVICYSEGHDTTDYCEILSIDDFAKYILNMKSYSEYLKDIPLGSFTKSQFFWNVYSQILRPDENLQNNCDNFILSSICEENDGEINIIMDYIDVDELNISINKSDFASMDDALALVLNEIKEICEDDDDNLVQQYELHHEYVVTPPTSYNELKNYIERYRILPSHSHGW